MNQILVNNISKALAAAEYPDAAVYTQQLEYSKRCGLSAFNQSNQLLDKFIALGFTVSDLESIIDLAD